MSASGPPRLLTPADPRTQSAPFTGRAFSLPPPPNRPDTARTTEHRTRISERIPYFKTAETVRRPQRCRLPKANASNIEAARSWRIESLADRRRRLSQDGRPTCQLDLSRSARTATTGMARTGVPPHIADKSLNHKTGTSGHPLGSGALPRMARPAVGDMIGGAKYCP